jgi:hypothetical protein
MGMCAMLGAACGGADGDGAADGDVGTIDYKLLGGFFGLEIDVHIDPGGELTRVDQRRGNSTTFTLDATELANLNREVNDAGFPALDASYECEAADDYLHTITVEIDANAYTVVTCTFAPHPGRLDPLVRTLTSMALLVETQN